MQNDNSISLSEGLSMRVEERVSRTQFETVSDYVEFVLEETLVHVESEGEGAAEKINESEVINRLESLGYLQK